MGEIGCIEQSSDFGGEGNRHRNCPRTQVTNKLITFSWLQDKPALRAVRAQNRVDLALIDMGNTAVTNVVTSVASQITCHQSIVLRGGMTHVNTFEAGGLMLTYCPANSKVCFENLFEVRPP